LIALAILALCVFPFIPKNSQKYQAVKDQASYIYFEKAFQNKLCELRQIAHLEGQMWLQNRQKGDVLFKSKDDFFFEELGLRAKGTSRLVLQEIYEKKTDSKHLYRLKLEMVFQGKTSKKRFPFYGYITLED